VHPGSIPGQASKDFLIDPWNLATRVRALSPLHVALTGKYFPGSSTGADRSRQLHATWSGLPGPLAAYFAAVARAARQGRGRAPDPDEVRGL